ncbi:RidA family protein [Robiginitalea marina]|uniref:RidA family protein n=1 Tax=Robiginitalea marina TaxID=2954105 RepID=A0ABT1AW63_9FLAO|nr:RidA family protein [Robiginitalea marina]MCO5724294.1 RidA family protein [Robiginitalea marina]
MKALSLILLLLLALTGCQQAPPHSLEAPRSIPVIEKTYIDTHNGYSEAVVVQSAGIKTIYISGQVGEGADLEAQMRSALGKLTDLLADQGASMDDVVKMNTYIVDYGPESLEVFRGVRKELMGEADMPASTLVGVAALALPEWLIEIEAVAVVPSAE